MSWSASWHVEVVFGAKWINTGNQIKAEPSCNKRLRGPPKYVELCEQREDETRKGHIYWTKFSNLHLSGTTEIEKVKEEMRTPQ